MKAIEYLWILSGDDYRIIRKCKKTTQAVFAAIGAIVAIIALLCFVGSYLTFTKVFGAFVIGLPISLFFAWMITNIYLLILYTLSKNVLPHVSSTGSRLLSKGVRIGFLLLIAAMVSKPIEVFLYSDALTKDIAAFKSKKVKEYTRLTEEYIQAEVKELQARIQKLNQQSSSPAQQYIVVYQGLIEEKEHKKAQLVREMEEKVARSDYYIQSVLILNEKYPACWLITLSCGIIFLSPMILKSVISEESEFNRNKKDVQISLVLNHYASFKAEYAATLNQIGTCFKRDATFQYYEHYVDAPFNTIRKKEVSAEPEADLTDMIYG